MHAHVGKDENMLQPNYSDVISRANSKQPTQARVRTAPFAFSPVILLMDDSSVAATSWLLRNQSWHGCSVVSCYTVIYCFACFLIRSSPHSIALSRTGDSGHKGQQTPPSL